MAHPRGESGSDAVRLDFDRRLMLQFRDSLVTSDHDPAMRWIVGGKAAQRSAITRHLGQTEYAVEFAISQQPVLRGLITPVRVGIRAIHARDNVPLPPITALDDKDQQKLLDASDVLRFTIVRNPYSRLVSTWRTKVFLRDPDTVDV